MQTFLDLNLVEEFHEAFAGAGHAFLRHVPIKKIAIERFSPGPSGKQMLSAIHYLGAGQNPSYRKNPEESVVSPSPAVLDAPRGGISGLRPRIGRTAARSSHGTQLHKR